MKLRVRTAGTPNGYKTWSRQRACDSIVVLPHYAATAVCKRLNRLSVYSDAIQLRDALARDRPCEHCTHGRSLSIWTARKLAGRIQYTNAYLYLYRSIGKLYRTTTATGLASGPDCMGLYPSLPQKDFCSRAIHGEERNSRVKTKPMPRPVSSYILIIGCFNVIAILQSRATEGGYGAVFCHCSSVEQLAMPRSLVKHIDGDLIGSYAWSAQAIVACANGTGISVSCI